MSISREAVVVLAALDLRRRPDHRSELKSQLLLGETVRVLGTRRDPRWVRVESRCDGYRGWVRDWGLRFLDARATWKPNLWVRVRYAEVRRRPGRARLLTPAFWNSRLAAGRRSGAWREVGLPDGRRGWIEAGAVAPMGRRGRTLEALLHDLVGVPYLWGGRTPLGFDCSGLVQQILWERGRRLPRDAHEQYRVCRPLAKRERPRRGDLVFFGKPGRRVAHVGIVLVGSLYAHARGTVRVNSLDPTNRLCDKDLYAMLRGFGRPPGRSRRGPYSC